MKSKVASMIRDARIRRGLTQKEISDRLGFTSSQFVSNLEKAKSPLPAHLVSELSRILKLPKRELIEAHVEDYKNLYARDAG